MNRLLGALEQTTWLQDLVQPLHFSITVRITGTFTVDRLKQALDEVQKYHPLLRVGIQLDANGSPHFFESSAEIPLRVVPRKEENHWQREVEQELSCSFDWTKAPLLRIVLLHSAIASDLIVTCHHSIGDGMSVVYLIRDILQVLGDIKPKNRLIRKQISNYPSLEQLIPEIVNINSQEASTLTSPLSDWRNLANALPSQRHRPQIHSTALSGEITNHLTLRCREQGASVHGTICAAFLLAIADYDRVSDLPLTCLSPINLRNYLKPALTDEFGLYISLGLAQDSVGSNRDLWTIARSLKTQLNQAMPSNSQFAKELQRQQVMALRPDPHLIAQKFAQNYPYDIMVSNLGRLPIESSFGRINLQALYGPALIAGADRGRVVGVSTLGDRLYLTLTCPNNHSSDAATSMLEFAIEQLSYAAK
jgi:NRPS condensation-like uncharacterized protein